MSHVRAIQWLCDNVDDDCDNNVDSDDAVKLAGELSSPAIVNTSASLSDSDANCPVVSVCIYCYVN